MFILDELIPIKHSPIKRGFDILFSLFVLVCFSPLYLFIAICIFWSSPGPLIYSHKRVGRGGVLFSCYKFRTMYSDADQRLQEILESDPLLKKEWETHYKLKKDPRVTPIGIFLRKTSMDELPQFWNVLKGDLSVVGPRPVVEEEIKQYFGEKAFKILSVRPGLTGPWQISGRSDISCYKKRIALDESYIEKQSLFFDIVLIAKTIPAVVLSKGAY